MGFPEGAAIHAQMQEGLANVAPAEPTPEEQQIVTAFDGEDSVMDPQDQDALKDDLAAAKGAGPSARIGQKRLRGRLWNIFGAIGRAVYRKGKWIAGAAVSGVISHYAVTWLIANETAIAAYLTWAQGSASAWFAQMMKALKSML